MNQLFIGFFHSAEVSQMLHLLFFSDI